MEIKFNDLSIMLKIGVVGGIVYSIFFVIIILLTLLGEVV